MDSNDSSVLIGKMDSWSLLLPLICDLAGELESNDSDDEYVSEKILELINAATRAASEDNTIQDTSMRFEHKSGLEVEFRLTMTLLKPGPDDDESIGEL